MPRITEEDDEDFSHEGPLGEEHVNPYIGVQTDVPTYSPGKPDASLRHRTEVVFCCPSCRSTEEDVTTSVGPMSQDELTLPQCDCGALMHVEEFDSEPCEDGYELGFGPDRCDHCGTTKGGNRFGITEITGQYPHLKMEGMIVCEECCIDLVGDE